MKQEHLESTKVRKTPPKDLLLQNLDLLAAAAALLVLGLHLAGVLLPLPARYAPTLDRLHEARAGVEQVIDNARFDSEAAATEAQGVAARVRSGWMPAGAPVPQGDADITYPAGAVSALRRGESNEIRFNKPRDVKAEAQRGSVTLSWLDDEDNNVRASEWVVFRAVGDGEFGEHARLPGDQQTYTDTDVQPGVRYAYRVVGVTTDPLVKGQIPRTEPSLPAAAEGLADFRITMEEADPKAGAATFLVEKWHENAWWPKRFTHRTGETIGALDAGSGVDYSTRRLFKALEVAEKTDTSKVHEVVFDSEGKVKLESGVPVTEEVQLTEVYEVVTARLEGGGLPPGALSVEKR